MTESVRFNIYWSLKKREEKRRKERKGKEKKRKELSHPNGCSIETGF